MRRAFLLEDDTDWQQRIKTLLQQNDFEVTIAANGQDAEACLAKFVKTQNFPDVYIFDYLMEKGQPNGLETAKKMLQERLVPSILLTAIELSNDIRRDAAEAGIPAKYKVLKEIFLNDEGEKDFLELVEDAIWFNRIKSPEGAAKFDEELKIIIIRNGLADDYFTAKYNSILFLEASGNACTLYFKDRKPYMFGVGIGKIAPQIGARFVTFWAVGRSHYININNIVRLFQGSIFFPSFEENKDRVAPGKDAYAAFKDKLEKYIIRTHN